MATTNTDSRHLVMTVSSKLRFDFHIDTICLKSLQTLGFITRTRNAFKTPQSKIIIYKAFVRSQLEYCSSTRNPYYKIYVEHIEREQNKIVTSSFLL